MLRGILAALLVTAAAVAVHREAHETSLDNYDRYTLPGFDAHVYMAMADAPRFFTLPPWGWRILTPALVHALPLPSARGFALVGHVALVLAGGLLYLFLRRLGCGSLASLLGVAAFALLRPVEEAVAYPFLVEPVTLALLVALLLGIEAGLGAGPLGLLAALLALSKETTLLLLPVIYFARRDRDGDGRAFLTALFAALPAGIATLALRHWAPAPAAPLAAGADALWLALWRLIEGIPAWGPIALLWGLTPLALLGALRPWGRLLLRRYGWALAVSWALPFAASVYTGDPTVPFFLDDIPRLLVYAMPVMVALGLAALDAVVAHREPPPARAGYGNRTALVSAALALAVALAPLVTQDAYRRADLSGPRDGRLVMTFCRESLVEAERLALGRQVDYEPERRSFLPKKIVPELMGRMRWFLRDGWGAWAAYGMGPVVAAERSAVLALPCLAPEDLLATLSLEAPRPIHVGVEINGRAIVELPVGPSAQRHRVLLPGGYLFRGDNELRLEATEPGLRLLGLRLRAAR